MDSGELGLCGRTAGSAGCGRVGWKLLAAWAVLEAVYLLLTYLVSTLRYARCEKEREEYGQLLLSLEREYSREGRRIDRVRKPEEDRR